MKNEIISEITRKMLPYLDNAQMERLQDVLVHCLWSVQIQLNEENTEPQPAETNEDLLNMFISAKRVEGCSNKTLRYYETSLLRLFIEINTHVTHIRTDDLRNYLSDYYGRNVTPSQRIRNYFFGQPTGFTPPVMNMPFNDYGRPYGINKSFYNSNGRSYYSNETPAGVSLGVHILDD